jgi:hypothetical protein
MRCSPAAIASSQPLNGELRSITWIKHGGKLLLLLTVLLLLPLLPGYM